MKKICNNKILNIEGENKFDNKFLLEYLDIDYKSSNIEVFFIEDLLTDKKNDELFSNLNGRWAMWSEVYSPKEELEIFQRLFDYSISNKKKIHIVGITLKEELDILEKYYEEEGYLRDDINCFIPNYNETLITVSVNIENLIWRGSDYKANGSKIFFIPPIRESGQNKAMFKGINKGTIAGINIKNLNDFNIKFLENCIIEEKILPITLGKVIKFNLEDIGFDGESKSLVINY